MSRIEDVFKRITGAATEPRPASTLERYTSERSSRVEENKVTSFLAPGPHAVEAKPPNRQKAPTPSAPAAPPPVPPMQNARQSADVSEAQPPGSNEKLIDIPKIFDYVGFLARSLRRHPFLALGAFTCAMGLTIVATVLMPKTYHVSTKLLAQRNAVMTALSNPGRAIPWDADAPTRAAAETVLRRDNLIALMQKTDLVGNWERTREPILRLKDWIMATVTRYRPTADDKLDAIIGLLENNMSVVAGPVGDGTVTIDLQWRNPEMAFQLVEAAQDAFLKARATAETNAIDESIRILEGYTEQLHGSISELMSQLQRTQGGRLPSRVPAGLAATFRDRSRLPPLPMGNLAVPSLAAALGLPELDNGLEPDPEIFRLRTTIASKKQEIGRLQDQQAKKVADLETQLAQLRMIYGPAHPSVQSTQQNLAAVSHDIPQLVSLRNDVEGLDRELNEREAAWADLQIKAELERAAASRATASQQQEPASPQQEPASVQQAPASVQQAPEPFPDQPVAAVETAAAGAGVADFASLRLRSELNQYESVLERTEGARIELLVSHAAFKYRYTVIRPAQVPKDPVKPNLKQILAAGFLASLLMALLAALATDLLGNRILETWQVERQLGLPVLGTPETA